MPPSHRNLPDIFDHLSPVPIDIIFATDAAFRKDQHPDKINLGMGVFKDDAGRSVVLDCVMKAERAYMERLSAGKENKDYDASAGYRPFVLDALKVLLGPQMLAPELIAGCVALSGSGALRLAAELLWRFLPPDSTRDVLVTQESWPNHFTIFSQVGFRVKTFPYFDQKKRAIDFDATLAALQAAAEHSVIILQPVGHNPTGQDFSKEQWSVVCDLVVHKQMLPIFDTAYQGFASGSLDEDGFAVRLFAKRKVQFIACQSFAKNLGMYGDRLGVLSVTCRSPSIAAAVQSNLNALVIRPMYSSPPRAPARIAHIVMSTPVLRERWDKELLAMSGRIRRMRVLLRAELERLGTPGTWHHIQSQIGMFSYLGLTPEQCKRMCEEFHVYLLPTGRVSMSGVRSSNVRRIAEAIDAVVRGTKSGGSDGGAEQNQSLSEHSAAPKLPSKI